MSPVQHGSARPSPAAPLESPARRAKTLTPVKPAQKSRQSVADDADSAVNEVAGPRRSSRSAATPERQAGQKTAAKTPSPSPAPGPTSPSRGKIRPGGDARPTGPDRGGASKRILAIDIGGSGLKAALLDADGKMISDRVRVDTPYPCPPSRMIATLTALCEPLQPFDCLSIGFPGVVRAGRVVTAPHFETQAMETSAQAWSAAGSKASQDLKKHTTAGDSTTGGPASRSTAEAPDHWPHFPLADALSASLSAGLSKSAKPKPAKLINDAEMQGLAVIHGKGLELVLTLGTGAGTALFRDGELMPHLELAHHPIRGRKSYNDYIGDKAREKIGKTKWNRRLSRMIGILDSLLHFDHLYIGGGNAERITFSLPDNITKVSNDAGITGGAALWRDFAKETA